MGDSSRRKSIVAEVNLDQAVGLAPLGGAAILLIYLLRLWLTERKLWMEERTRLNADHETRMNRKTAEWQEERSSLRKRISELEERQDRYPQ